MNIERSIWAGAEGRNATFEPLILTNTVSNARPRKKKASTLRESDWEPYKDRIIQLHVVEKRSLPELRILIEQEFGFIAEYVGLPVPPTLYGVRLIVFPGYANTGLVLLTGNLTRTSNRTR